MGTIAKTNGRQLAAAVMPALVSMSYGKVKRGKTTDAIYAYHDAFFVAQPAAVLPALFVLGEPIPADRVKPAQGIEQITKVLPVLAKRGFRRVVGDDFSLVAQRTVMRYDRKLSGFKLWGKLREILLELRDTAEGCGISIHFTCHERPPAMTPKGKRLGGPDLPGAMPEDFPAVASFVARIVHDSSVPGPHPFAYSCEPSDDFVTGDRTHIVRGRAPQNLAEILRAAGYELPRPKGMEWIEVVVAQVAPKLAELDVERERDVLRKLAAKFQNKPLPQLRWLLRDVTARAALMRKGPATELAAYWTDPLSADVVPLEGGDPSPVPDAPAVSTTAEPTPDEPAAEELPVEPGVESTAT